MSALKRFACLCLAAALTAASGRPAVAASSQPRALWVWDPAALLTDPDRRRQFFDFCHVRGIGVAWMQIGTTPAGRGRRDVDHGAEWRELLTDAHRAGLAIHALDGNPRYARREQHPLVLAIVDAVIAFNAKAPADQRFDGVHFDNEPYLLLDWQDPPQRERLLGDFLDLNARAQAKARAAGIAYGIDIPFWWQASDDETRDAIGAVTFHNVRKPASFHCLDMLDNVGIMDYRNVAGGGDGIVAHAQDLLAYADRAGHARVYVGVETSTTDDAGYWFLTGVPRAAFRDVVTGRARGGEVLDRGGLTVVADGTTVHLGVRVAARPTLRDLSDAVGVLADLARLFALPTGEDAIATRTGEAIRALHREGEWQDPRADTFADPVSHRLLGAVRALRVMLPKLTFAGKSNDDMERELSAADAQFAAHASYAGIAVHHWESYRARFDPAPRAAAPSTPLQHQRCADCRQ